MDIAGYDAWKLATPPHMEEPDIVDHCSECNEPLYAGDRVYSDGEPLGNFCGAYCALKYYGLYIKEL